MTAQSILDEREATRERRERDALSKRTQRERNKLGQFPTPIALADDVVRFALAQLNERERISFLDPAFGAGAFFSSLVRLAAAGRIESAQGFEIDEELSGIADELWSHYGLALTRADFTRALPPAGTQGRPNLVVCNPPYVRHHHLSQIDKVRIYRLIGDRLGLEPSGLSGLYSYFVLLSHGWMRTGAVAAWLIPSEFMDVNYGRTLKQYLTSSVTLLRIHRFDPASVQFADALVSSAAVWFKNEPPSPNQSFVYSYGGSIEAPLERHQIPIERIKKEPKWGSLVGPQLERPMTAPGPTIGDLFKVTRGIATGANHFFIMTTEKARERGIPSEFLRPILPSPRYLPFDEVEADTEGVPKLPNPLFLLDCSLEPKAVERDHPDLWNYLNEGLKARIHEGFLCRSRYPWYSQEKRAPAPFLCTYMGRSTAGETVPFRFILNHSRAIATNVYLLMYPRPPLGENMAADPSAKRSAWMSLQRIDAQALLRVGRVYGGGLHKVEPKELGRASAAELIQRMPPRMRHTFISGWAAESREGRA